MLRFFVVHWKVNSNQKPAVEGVPNKRFGTEIRPLELDPDYAGVRKPMASIYLLEGKKASVISIQRLFFICFIFNKRILSNLAINLIRDSNTHCRF